jgi:hypothetical protein
LKKLSISNPTAWGIYCRTVTDDYNWKQCLARYHWESFGVSLCPTAGVVEIYKAAGKCVGLIPFFGWLTPFIWVANLFVRVTLPFVRVTILVRSGSIGCSFGSHCPSFGSQTLFVRVTLIVRSGHIPLSFGQMISKYMDRDYGEK